MIKGFFLKNTVLKIAAVILSVILWLFVTAKGQTEISLNAPIEYTNIPSGLEITRHTARTANIVIRGHESILKNVKQRNVSVNVDLSKAKKGEGTFQIRKDDVKVPLAVSITKVEPLSVKIIFEETVSKTVVIKPFISGSPENGYYVKTVDVKPDDVVIEGAKSEVRKVGYIRTEQIDITGLTEGLKQEAGLDAGGSNIRLKIEKVDISIVIERRGK